MIFLGDIALPKEKDFIIDCLPDCFSQPVVANLEGSIVEESSLKERKLYSNKNVIPFLKELNVQVVSLANNHITDIPSAFGNTKDELGKAGIGFCGAGHSAEEASRPALFQDDTGTYVFLSFGWDVIECEYVGEGKLGVNPLERNNILTSIENAKKAYPSAKIICLFHWGYCLEQYPHPVHRELAKRALDAGADIIVGHHPHCVQGVEMYGSKPVFYSLGNWAIPHNTFFNGSLRFPDYTRKQLAMEWTDNRIVCHWFRYSPEQNKLFYEKSENLEESLLQQYPFLPVSEGAEHLSEYEYVRWFRHNRVKKKGLPIFRYNDTIFATALKKNIVWRRQNLINALRKLGLRK
jgi:poly-gamma-glutamate synthesis protein (capsule biosynthesis protein)